MIFNITSLSENKSLNIFKKYNINLSKNYNLFDSNVKCEIKGEFIKKNDIITFKGNIKADLIFNCDRCLDKIDYKLDCNLEERFSNNKNIVNNVEDIWVFENNNIDLRPCIYSNISINLPMTIICKENCKGLCHICGTNLNFNSCNCNEKITDSPFEILKSIFTNNKEV